MRTMTGRVLQRAGFGKSRDRKRGEATNRCGKRNAKREGGRKTPISLHMTSCTTKGRKFARTKRGKLPGKLGTPSGRHSTGG